ncbi:hypothetical protein [Nonomuraea turkmeniaca]|uniref:hypothetical protein n=1 Tax=Nonomuraea turkmeniaca TaxID=103838 RepID=UPI001476B3AA|nr:hypothetical protein [Nonomuraea turkmeniaca]
MDGIEATRRITRQNGPSRVTTRMIEALQQRAATLLKGAGWRSQALSRDIGAVRHTGVAGLPDGRLHVFAVNAAGTPYHTIRGPGGWQDFGNIDGQADYPGAVGEIDGS